MENAKPNRNEAVVNHARKLYGYVIWKILLFAVWFKRVANEIRISLFC